MSRQPPPRAKTDISHVTARNTVQARLLGDYALHQDWKAVGTKNGVSGGMAYRVAAHGYEPRNTAIRTRLGFPAMAPAPVCPVHGVVHARQCRQVPAWLEQAVAFLAQRQKVMRAK